MKSGNAASVPACISNAACLHRLGADLGVRKLISGSVLADGPRVHDRADASRR